MKHVASTPEISAANEEIIAVLQKYRSKITIMEALALLSQMVGQTIMMQDPLVTPEIAMEIVVQNIKVGREDVFKRLDETQGNA